MRTVSSIDGVLSPVHAVTATSATRSPSLITAGLYGSGGGEESGDAVRVDRGPSGARHVHGEPRDPARGPRHPTAVGDEGVDHVRARVQGLAGCAVGAGP